MELTETQLGAVLVVVAALALVAVALAAAALAGQRRVRRAYSVFSGDRREDVLTLLQQHVEQVGALRSEVAGLRGYAEKLRELERQSLSRRGLVRYDAFEDMGGHLSFSMALLNERGDGLVVSAINGRTDTRVYAKAVAAGDSRHNLSREEAEAIARAMDGNRDEEATETMRRRRRSRGSRRDASARRETAPRDDGYVAPLPEAPEAIERP